MVAVIFEVVPAEGRQDEYLTIAKDLKPKLDTSKVSFRLNDSPACLFLGKFCHSLFGRTNWL
jgi:hypothetical protein